MSTLAMVLGFCGPELAAIIARERLRSSSEQVLASLQLARGEAIKRNGRVVYCRSADGVTCAASGGWEAGGMVFHDQNNNGEREPLEPILSFQQAFQPDVRIHGNSTLKNYISYSADGQARHAGSGAFQAGTLTLCLRDATATEGRQIVINSGGRPRVQTVVLASCA